MKYVLRELSIISTLEHTNITGFYGAYMSPSSSEVKVLMELCEGRSLEDAGLEIRRRQGRVGEKVAGRVAEGVRSQHRVNPSLANPTSSRRRLGSAGTELFTQQAILSSGREAE